MQRPRRRLAATAVTLTVLCVLAPVELAGAQTAGPASSTNGAKGADGASMTGNGESAVPPTGPTSTTPTTPPQPAAQASSTSLPSTTTVVPAAPPGPPLIAAATTTTVASTVASTPAPKTTIAKIVEAPTTGATAQRAAPKPLPAPVAASPQARSRASTASTAAVESQVARLLAAAAAARSQLSAQIVEAEAGLAQREAESASAQADLRNLEAQEVELQGVEAAARTRLDRVEGTLPGLAVASEAAAARADRRTTPVGHPLAPGRSPTDQAARAQATLTDATRLRDQAALQLRASRADLELNDTRLAAARDAVSGIAAELGQRHNALDGLRRQLAAMGPELPRGPFEARPLSTQVSGVPSPGPLALADVPPDYLELYRRHAESCPGLSWTVLAAIGSIESAHGRSTAPGVQSAANFAGAMGPMQFMPPTWGAYGLDGNGDGVRDVYNPSDAVAGAANYLCASGAGELPRLAGAIWNYNHADWYVASVIQLAAAYGGGAFAAPPVAVTARLLVDNPNLTLSAQARADLLSGATDKRAIDLLSALATNHRITVSVIKSGHAQFVAGTNRVSNHFHGRGVDITHVDGVPVTASSAAALEVSLAILTTESAMRPSEFGSPWPELARFPGGFSDDDHADHLHIGWS